MTVDDEISKVYKFLPGIESFARFQNDERIAADLLVVIDASSLDRAGNVSQCVSAPKTLNIDHHISNTEMPIICILIQLRLLLVKLCMS